MRLERVKIKKFKKLENIDEMINGHHMIIAGDNSIGKSTLIQFIEIALGKSTNVPPSAEGEGVVITSKDGQEYTFHVKFKDGKPVISITSPDGSKDSRKSYLQQVCGANEFDIDEFVELSKSAAGRKKQVEIFKSWLDKEIQEGLKALENKIDRIFQDRTEVNRSIKTVEGAMKANPLYGQNLTQFKQVDVSDNMAKLKEIQDFNSKVDRVKDNFDNRSEEIFKEDKEVEVLKERLLQMEKSLAEKKALQSQASDWIDANPKKSTSEIVEIINNATRANNDYELAKTLEKQKKEYDNLLEESGEMTSLIESQRQAISDTITSMESPVEDLMYNDDGLVYKGIPVNPDCLSTSEIMELGIKLKMSENPDLGIVFLQRGESLGKKRLEEIIEICNKNNFELVMEEVRRGQETLKIELFS